MSNSFSLVDLSFAGIFILFFAWHLALLFRTNSLYRRAKRQIRDFFLDMLRTIDGTFTPPDDLNLNELLRHVIDDVYSILGRSEVDEDRKSFITRYRIKRETRPEIDNQDFGRAENLFRTLIEIYPPLGILGTVVSMFVSVGETGQGDELTSQILSNFQTAMWTTISGLALWVLWTLIYAGLERKWERIPEVGEKARKLVWEIDLKAGETSDSSEIEQ